VICANICVLAARKGKRNTVKYVVSGNSLCTPLCRKRGACAAVCTKSELMRAYFPCRKTLGSLIGMQPVPLTAALGRYPLCHCVT